MSPRPTAPKGARTDVRSTEAPINAPCSPTCGCSHTESAIARVNGVPLHAPTETLDEDELRQRACTELLRQAAQRAGLLAADDAPVDGIAGEAAAEAIEALLEQSLQIPEPSETACRRHHAAHAARYRVGERALLRHILFAVTPGVDVVALRKRAEGALLDVRSHDGTGDPFVQAARTLSNCPSGQDGGALGWLGAADCAPEFAREVFGQPEIGVLPRLVHSRFGLHVVEVQQREAGADQPFEAVHGAIAMTLRQQSYVTALRQYLALLAGQAQIEGVALDAADTPLVQ
ncbi:MAG: peptidylprolyl isomerase [Curvibacter sp.]